MPQATKGKGGAVGLKKVGGRLVSAKSKTGNPECSQAMSVWVKSRFGGPAATAAVHATLGKCRSQARQNKGAAAKQASGKLAEGRGTWQRSERAQALRQARPAAAKPAAAPADRFALAQPRKTTTPFASGGGKTRPLLEELRGANARDLPGQSTMFPRERADAHTKAVSAADWRAVLERSKVKGGPQRDRKAARLKAQRAELHDARAATVRDVHPDAVHFDPERFQYKLHADSKTGSVGSLADAESYNPKLAGVLQVWKDPADGKTYVVNGHNRLDLAKRLGARKVAVMHVDAADSNEARAQGAVTNIAEGRGTSTDAAEFFRTSKLTPADLKAKGVVLKDRTAAEGLAIAGLEEGLYRRHKGGDLPAERAAIIGGSGLGHAQQASLGKHLDKTRGVTNSHLKELVDNARAAETVKHTTHDLFGSNEEDVSLANHRAGVQSHVKDQLGKEKRVFGTVAKAGNAAALTRAGNVIDAHASAGVSQTAAENLAVFDTLKNRRGHVADLLNDAARRIHKGESPKAVHHDTYKRLPAAIQAALAGG